MNIGQIPPSHLRTINAQNLQWKVVLGEACDNSFDSGANWVRVAFTGTKQLEISDDGGGCDNIEAMLTIGKHYRQASTKLGRFGVGLKDLACWLWGELLIHTIHGGVLRTAAVDWERLAKSDSWNVPDPVEHSINDGRRGTRLIFRKACRNRPDLDSLAVELGYLFAPALWSGKQIAIECGRKKITVAGWKLPEFEGEIVRESFLVDGKQVELTAGVVASDHTNQRKGFTFIHEHRVILNSSLGSNGHSVARVCGLVVLGIEWKLGRNKDAISEGDDQMSRLEEEIFARVGDVLRRAESQANLLRNSAFEGAVTTALRGLLPAAVEASEDRKARRKPAESQSGAVDPVGSSIKHRKARREQPGSTFRGSTKLAAIRFEWESTNDGAIGRADLPGNVVYLNERHPRLEHHRKMENVDAITDMCCMILIDAVIKNREASKLSIVRDCSDLTSAISEVLRRQQETDDAQFGVVA